MEKDLNVICNDSTSVCSVRRFQQGVGFTQPCNGVARTFFEDLTNNSVDILITVNNNTTLPCVMTVIIELKNGETIERVVPAAVFIPNQGTFSNSLIFEFKSVKRVQIRCDGNPLGFCNGSFFLDKFFCACCSDKSDKKCECGKDRKHHNDECGCGKEQKQHHDECYCKKDHKPHRERYKFEKHNDKYNDHDYCRCNEHTKW